MYSIITCNDSFAYIFKTSSLPDTIINACDPCRIWVRPGIFKGVDLVDLTYLTRITWMIQPLRRVPSFLLLLLLLSVIVTPYTLEISMFTT